jgi:hypothetical protein
MRVDLHGLTRLEIGRRLDFDQQQNLARVIVSEDVPRLGVESGDRPLDGACLESGRKCPIDAGREAGVAGVLPVGVPAGHGLQIEPDGHRPAGDDAIGIGEEPGFDELLPLIHLRVAKAGGGQKEEEEGFQNAHGILYHAPVADAQMRGTAE